MLLGTLETHNNLPPPNPLPCVAFILTPYWCFGLSVFLVSRRICPPQVPPDYLHARFTVQPHGSITLYGRRDLPLVEARMVASATAELRADASMVSCRL